MVHGWRWGCAGELLLLVPFPASRGLFQACSSHVCTRWSSQPGALKHPEFGPLCPLVLSVTPDLGSSAGCPRRSSQATILPQKHLRTGAALMGPPAPPFHSPYCCTVSLTLVSPAQPEELRTDGQTAREPSQRSNRAPGEGTELRHGDTGSPQISASSEPSPGGATALGVTAPGQGEEGEGGGGA